MNINPTFISCLINIYFKHANAEPTAAEPPPTHGFNPDDNIPVYPQ